jgi:hypothetical protein
MSHPHHRHRCARCGHYFDCTRGESCSNEKRGLCGPCFEAVAQEPNPHEPEETLTCSD